MQVQRQPARKYKSKPIKTLENSLPVGKSKSNPAISGRQTMDNNKLDQEEQEMLEAYDAGEFTSALSPERKQLLEESAKQALKRDKKISIRISSRDLTAIQVKALQEGIPYQTLVASIIHKYVSGDLYDESTNRNVNPEN